MHYFYRCDQINKLMKNPAEILAHKIENLSICEADKIIPKHLDWTF